MKVSVVILNWNVADGLAGKDVSGDFTGDLE